MNEIETILEQARLFFVQHAPTDALRGAVPAALIFLVAGVGLSVLGAKLARFGITSAFVGLGGVLGFRFGQEMGFQPLICALVGAFLVGVIAVGGRGRGGCFLIVGFGHLRLSPGGTLRLRISTRGATAHHSESDHLCHPHRR